VASSGVAASMGALRGSASSSSRLSCSCICSVVRTLHTTSLTPQMYIHPPSRVAAPPPHGWRHPPSREAAPPLTGGGTPPPGRRHPPSREAAPPLTGGGTPPHDTTRAQTDGPFSWEISVPSTCRIASAYYGRTYSLQG
jgi:hypothetical protein